MDQRYCHAKGDHPPFRGPVCPACKADAPAITEETRKFSLSDPGESLREEMGEIKWRLNMLKLYDDRVNALVKACRARLPLHLHVMVSIEPKIFKPWNEPKKREVRFALEVTAKEAESWDELNGLFEELDNLGYDMAAWKSEDHANYGYRQYTWATQDGVFTIRVKLHPKEVEEIDPATGAPTVKCKKVLLGKRFHRGYDHSEDVYAFDCGQGEDALREQAKKEGRL